MFSTIFLFEIKRWLKQPVFYVYCAIYFSLAYFTSLSSLGAFDGVTSTTDTPVYINAPLNIAGFFNSFSTLIYFLLPTIIGASVIRDYMYQVHQVLFSYPLHKFTYLSAKFSSSFLVVTFIAFLCAVGFYAAQFYPGINLKLLGPNNFQAYLEGFFATIIPNFLLFGSIIFALVTFTRSIYVGFICVIILMLLQTLLDIANANVDNRYLVALLDPFGFEAIMYHTKYWSIAEQNTNLLPFKGVLLYNRLIWSSVALLILAAVYYTFSFSQSGFNWWRTKNGKSVSKDNFGNIIRINLPNVSMNYSFWNNLKLSFRLSKVDFKFLIRNWTFYILLFVAFIFTLIVISMTGEIYGTTTYPVTWQMLNATSSIYGFFSQIMLLLFSGMLIQRARMSNINLLVDATATPNWVLLLSKAIALYKLMLLVFLVSMLNGVIYQLVHGFYDLELGHYFFELFVLGSVKAVYMILFSLLINSFFKNYFIGFILGLFIVLGVPLLAKIGIEQNIYKLNADPGYNYSDMNGYGSLRHFLYYRLYWFLLACIFFIATLLIWRRGIVVSAKERLLLAAKRFNVYLSLPLVLFLLGFLGLGYSFYYMNNVVEPFQSNQERELLQVKYEKDYKRYESIQEPRLTQVFVTVDLDPEQRNMQIKGDFTYKNKSAVPIDTLFMNLSSAVITEVSFSKAVSEILNDKELDVKIFALGQSLLPGDSLQITYAIKNKPNNFLYDQSPVKENGTFIDNSMFPTLKYANAAELANNAIRQKYDLPNKTRMHDPRDSSQLRNTYISQDADWINFEAVVSTVDNQTALAPGYLQKEWTKDGKRYFHYKMDAPILNFYAFMSARYEVKKEQYQGKSLEIYYHPNHTYNLDRMMLSMKKSLDYYEPNYSPYQFKQMRIIEFPKTKGTFAQAFANTVPFSESIGFIAKVDEDDPKAVDYAYTVVSHEFAHQWWAHQVIGANVQGATMLSESLAEYSSLKVLEKTYGKDQMRRYLKESLDSYLAGRASEALGESPLMYNEGQAYIHYNKGSLVMYAMSELLGENNFNQFLKTYIQKTAFQNPPYTTAIEFVDQLKTKVPDSLSYAVKDMFETITLYDNYVKEVNLKELANGKYEVTLNFVVSKYRSDAKGKKSFSDSDTPNLTEQVDKKEVKSLPLNDYIEIGVFAEQKKEGKHLLEQPLLIKKMKINKINNSIKLILDKKPVLVGVDPYNKLIDTNSGDNRKDI
ncbi:ABC transporter permease/M1 family aminopeptidase [Sphingobacterium sp. HJSM2_6]|uniref:ABC transporter permease/M1 family aminopeptidase n=1 Tax=Sphingobacterium sp. HJSM2_6 TaxID=3366264 RepID=UPI003BCAD727